MTAQYCEVIILEGEAYGLCAEPLKDVLEMMVNMPKFGLKCTALWRGYVGTWEICEGRLYLTGFTATLIDGSEACLQTLFPEVVRKVFASWFSGTLRIPQGELIEYVHKGFDSIYESDLLFTVSSGVILSTSIRNNCHQN